MTKQFSALLGVFALMCALVSAVRAQRRVPTVDDLLTIKSVGGTQISPDGKLVAYTVGYGDFKQDAFITQIWLTDSGKKFQLTRGESLRPLRAGRPTDGGSPFSAIAWTTRIRSS